MEKMKVDAFLLQFRNHRFKKNIDGENIGFFK